MVASTAHKAGYCGVLNGILCHKSCTDAQCTVHHCTGPEETILNQSQGRRGLFVQLHLYHARTEVTRSPTTHGKNHIVFLVLYANTQNQKKKLKPTHKSTLERFLKLFYHSN